MLVIGYYHFYDHLSLWHQSTIVINHQDHLPFILIIFNFHHKQTWSGIAIISHNHFNHYLQLISVTICRQLSPSVMICFHYHDTLDSHYNHLWSYCHSSSSVIFIICDITHYHLVSFLINMLVIGYYNHRYHLCLWHQTAIVISHEDHEHFMFVISFLSSGIAIISYNHFNNYLQLLSVIIISHQSSP